jgi:catechol 2,3-dioxygenase-like lactoylglutathione lyase family enzyme
MAILRYVAFLAEEPAKLVDFYHRFLGTEELGHSPEGDISITDGFYNLTFFRKRPALNEMKMDCGLHHIGLEVDDLEEIKGRFLALNPRGVILQESEDVHHGQIRIHDPECLPVSLSTQGFGVPASNEKRFPRIRHIAYNALDPEMMLRFYTQVFGMREVPSRYLRRQQGRGTAFAPTARPPWQSIRSTTASKATRRDSASTTSAF